MARDYIEEARAESKIRYGKDISATELAAAFAGHDFEARIFHLKNLQTDESLSLNDAAKRHAYERALKSTHERLRKVDR